MKKDLVKLYAAFRSGCLGDNILEAYFPFLANIICEENWASVDEKLIATKFNQKYKITIPLTFIRQVLGIGLVNGSIVVDHGKYIAVNEKLKGYRFDCQEFETQWKKMITTFSLFCDENGLDISHFDVEARILDCVDNYDESILVKGEIDDPENSDIFDYGWFLFLQSISMTSPDIFNFVVAVCSSNIMKQTVFYACDGNDSFKGLNVFLDSPMIFALLKMDSSARTDSCELLLKELQKAGCIVQIFDHNFQEVDSILARAGGWAISVDYDIQKANNAARYFHDELLTAQAISEFCASVEDKLNTFGITVKKVDYDSLENQFQEDEKILYKMIEDRYLEHGHQINEERRRSILVDVRSIIMIYRERRGQTATKIQTSRDIFLSLNGTIANVCKKYESNRSINAGHIPACISVDLFGAVLWLFSPLIMMEYQRKQLLADCFNSLRPSKKMLEKYIESLILARKSGEIDEKTFLFMRSHSVVNDALMNVTKGDYARFNDRTYLEVYNDIVSCADKKFDDEVVAHNLTKEQLITIQKEKEELAAKHENELKESEEKIQILQSTINKKDFEKFDKKCRLWGGLLAFAIFGIPYLFVTAVIEIFKSVYSKFSFYSIIYIGALVLLSVVSFLLFQKGKALCYSKVKKYLSRND